MADDVILLTAVLRAMSLRQNFDSFTSKHRLQDAENEFIEALYRLRAAEDAGSPNRIELKTKVGLLDRKLGYHRLRLYSGIPIEEFGDEVAPNATYRCPAPSWASIKDDCDD